ncbi:retrotransposon protein, putative, ty1-copia subclass [Tanacetum coccineum]
MLANSEMVYGSVMPFDLAKALTIFMDLKNRVCRPKLDKSIIGLLVDVLVYSRSKEEHEMHFQKVLESLTKEKLKTKLSKYKLWMPDTARAIFTAKFTPAAWVKCVWGDNNVEKVTENINGTHERNVEQCSIQIGSTTIPKEVIVTNSPTSYAKLVTGESSRKSVNFHTLIASAGKGTDVAISVESVRAISERFANTVYGFFLGKQMAYSFGSKDGMDSMLENCPWFIRNNPFILKQWNLDVNLWNGFNVYNVMVYGFFLGKPMVYSVFGSKDGMDSMIENGPWFIRNNPFILKQWNPDVNLLKEDVCNVMVLGKFHGVPMTSFSDDELSAIATNLEWKPPMCSSCQVFGHVLDEGPKHIVSDVEKNLKNPRQAARVKKDDDLGTNKGHSNSVEKRPNFDMKPLLKVVSTTNVDSDSKVENEVDDHAVFMASTGLKRGADSGYGTNTLLEQWRTTKHDDYDPYDDDLYESHEMSENL